MRVMVIVKASAETEKGVLPTEQQLAEMGAYNEKLVKAGVLLAGEGLHPTSKGARVRFSGGQTELVSGYWLWQVASMDEAKEWARRCPAPTGDGGGELEIRPVLEAADFGEALTPELQAHDARLRAEVESRQ